MSEITKRAAADAVLAGFNAWAAKPHNAKWVKRIDGTPIPNDLTINIQSAIMELPAAPALKVNPLDVEGLINIVLQEVHGPLWRSILSSEDCLNRVCADQSPESCICAPKIDRIENHARAQAKARILPALKGGDV